MSEIFSKVSQIKDKIISEMSSVKDEASLKEFQEKHLSKKSELSQLMSEIKNLANEEKAKFGQCMNEARAAVNEAFQKKAQEINDALIAQKLKKETIDTFGVVSKEVAYEMADKGRKLLDVDICVSVTGNAGPTAEPGEEGVGSVYFGIATKEKVVVTKKVFSGSREEIRQKTLLALQEGVLKLI